MSLAPYQERVINERGDLSFAIHKLNSFIESPLFATVDAEEQPLLREQAEAMQKYHDCLTRRIARWIDLRTNQLRQERRAAEA